MKTPEINIRLQPSMYYSVLLSIVIIGSISIVITINTTIFIKSILFMSIISYGGYLYWRHGLLTHPNSVKQIFLDKSGWHIRNTAGITSKIQICGHSTLTQWVCVLRYSIENQWFKSSCLIFRDAVLIKEDFRKLIVYVKSVRVKE